VTESDEGAWRVRVGVGLLQHTPMSPERRALFDKEAEREAKAIADEAEARRQAALERRQELEFRGVASPRSHAEVLQAASFGMDRADAQERRREREAAEILGRPKPTVNKLLHDAKAEREARQAVEETTPVSKAELGRTLQALKDLVGNTFGKRVP
jgi:hypothetical protein